MASLYEYFYESIDLRSMGILLGLILVATHAYAFYASGRVSTWLTQVPRNRKLGIAILILDAAWAYLVISNMDLGEFFAIRGSLKLAIPICCFLVITLADDFLAVRAIGVFLLLAACPILGAAFLEDPATRLFLPLFAYVIILAGLFWVGMPYLMRDAIGWVTAQPKRWRLACSAGTLYGLAILICAFAFY